MQTVFDRLLAHFSTQSHIARAFGVSPQAVNRWKKRGVPKDRALDAENVTGGIIGAREVLEETRPQ